MITKQIKSGGLVEGPAVGSGGADTGMGINTGLSRNSGAGR